MQVRRRRGTEHLRAHARGGTALRHVRAIRPGSVVRLRSKAVWGYDARSRARCRAPSTPSSEG